MTKRINRLGVRAASTLAAMVLAANAAWALEPFRVQDIRIEGLQRVEPGTVFASIPLRVGDQYDDDKGAAAIRSLFALGLFKDIRLEANGNVLVVVVEERPTDRKSTRLNSSHLVISYAVFCLKKKKTCHNTITSSRPRPTRCHTRPSRSC